jgi:hypothetical protein
MRAYRLDSIASAKATDQRLIPGYLVELPPFNTRQRIPALTWPQGKVNREVSPRQVR